jgi:hypothetical protein
MRGGYIGGCAKGVPKKDWVHIGVHSWNIGDVPAKGRVPSGEIRWVHTSSEKTPPRASCTRVAPGRVPRADVRVAFRPPMYPCPCDNKKIG